LSAATTKVESPELIALFGQSGSQLPQLMQSSLIFIAMAVTSLRRHGAMAAQRGE
jgi:hypothetical protein